MSLLPNPKQNKFLKHFPSTVYCYIPDNDSSKPTIHSEQLQLERNEQGYGIFFSVNGFSGGRRISDNLRNINAFYADIDYPNKLNRTETEIKRYKQDVLMELIEDNRPIPTYIIETKNGLHVYWVLENPILIADLNPEQQEKLKIVYRDIQAAIIDYFDADPAAKDITRVLRVPGTMHLKDPKDPFKIKISHYTEDAIYSFQELRDAFLLTANEIVTEENRWATAVSEKGGITPEVKKVIEQKYPKLERPSMKKLMSKQPGTVPEGFRNKALLICAAACAESEWDINKCYDYFTEYHGLSLREIRKTIKSAYANKYDFGYNNEVMEKIVTTEEKAMLSEVTSAAVGKTHKAKRQKEADEQKELFQTYEYLLADRFPYLKAKVHGDFYDYEDGVYNIKQLEDVRSLVVRQMLSDGLTNYRKTGPVGDKLMCFRSIDGRSFRHEDENNNPSIINVKNGLLDINTYTLSPHTPDYLSTNQIPIEFKDEACPRWELFVREIMNGDMDQVKLLQQIAGLCLTTDTSFAKAFIFYGMGANGKSMFTRTLSKIVGKGNVSNLSLATLNRQFGLYGLVGKKMNIIDEISGNYFESNIIKGIISGEAMMADVKYRPDPLEFTPVAKILFSVNELPKINDTTPGIYRRFIIVPFTQSFLSNPDIHLEEKLERELSGILKWSIEGLKSLRESGRFTETEKNTRALAQFKVDNSPYVEFLTQIYDPAGPSDEIVDIELKTFYEEYANYCRASGYKPKAMVNLIKEIEHTQILPYEARVVSSNGRRYVTKIKRRFTPFGEKIIYNQHDAY